jgi:hypothetical protein
VTVVTIILVLLSHMLEFWYLVTVCSWQFQVESGSLVSLGPQFILGKCKLNSFICLSWQSYLVLGSIRQFSVGNVRNFRLYASQAYCISFRLVSILGNTFELLHPRPLNFRFPPFQILSVYLWANTTRRVTTPSVRGQAFCVTCYEMFRMFNSRSIMMCDWT